ATFFFSLLAPHPRSTLFPYTTLFRSEVEESHPEEPDHDARERPGDQEEAPHERPPAEPLVQHEGHAHADDGGLEHEGPDEVEGRSEEHTSELQSRFDLVCRLLLEKKK